MNTVTATKYLTKQFRIKLFETTKNKRLAQLIESSVQMQGI